MLDTTITIPVWAIIAWFGLFPLAHVIVFLRFGQLYSTKIKGNVLTQTLWVLILPVFVLLLALFGNED